jgi:AraC-like DNA-binding protein
MTAADEAGREPAHAGTLWSPLFESNDVERSRVYMSAMLSSHVLEHRSDESAPVFRHRHARCGALSLHELSYSMHGGEARIHVPQMPGMSLLEVNLFGRAELRCGRETVPFGSGHICVVNASRPHTKRWCSDGRQIFVMIHQPVLQDALAEIIRRPVAVPVQFDPRPRPIDDAATGLVDLVRLIYTNLDHGRVAFGGSNAARTAQRLLVELLLETMPNNYSHLIEAPEAPKPAHVRRAVEFIHAHSAAPIGLADIAAAANVSVRSLYEGFRRHCGQSPMAYLRGVRLDRARAELRRGAASGATVTDVALSCGFNHLSKFAKSYHERFGELPSKTLIRSG